LRRPDKDPSAVNIADILTLDQSIDVIVSFENAAEQDIVETMTGECEWKEMKISQFDFTADRHWH
jgi:hypothetical protein